MSGDRGPTAEAQDYFVERLRRDFYVKRGKLFWRKRDVERFEGRFPARACAIFNTRFGDKPAGLPRKGERDGRSVRLGAREWPVETLIQALETGLLPNGLPQDGNPYHAEIFIGEGPLGRLFDAARAASGLKGED
ncbi:MAG TPA: hypothetical protein VGG77_05630, partial [Roseiarcus sp.]